MAFSVGDKVRVADQSSSYRRNRGVVQEVTGDLHQVRLEGHGCKGKVALRTDQLKEDLTEDNLQYTQCS